MALSERDLALEPSDRAVIIGASGCGKSTLADRLITFWQDDYCHPDVNPRIRGRCLIADTKPRFRATASVIGPSIKKRYKDSVPGDVIRGVVLDHPAHWDLVWDPNLNPWQTVIVQAPDASEEWALWLCQHAINKLFTSQKVKRPSMLYVDEGLDFFGPTGQQASGRPIKRCYRAGREKGLTSVVSSQRPVEIHVQTMTESNKGMVFRLNDRVDQKTLSQRGFPAPPVELTPFDDWKFWLYQRGKLVTPRPLMLPAA